MFLSFALLALSPPQAAEARLFVSPMGEPFRGDAESRPDRDWFAQADADHDGKLTRAEMVRDADRFFALLDLDRSGEIDPREIERYETILLPEVATSGGGRGPRDVSLEPDASSNGITLNPAFPYRARGGAGRFSYIENPQPIASADDDFNRGVSRAEFERAAGRRFDLLDSKHDGALEFAELPEPPRSKVKRRRR